MAQRGAVQHPLRLKRGIRVLSRAGSGGALPQLPAAAGGSAVAPPGLLCPGPLPPWAEQGRARPRRDISSSALLSPGLEHQCYFMCPVLKVTWGVVCRARTKVSFLLQAADFESCWQLLTSDKVVLFPTRFIFMADI